MEVIAELDFAIYACVSSDIRTDEVVITEKQFAHILESHPVDSFLLRHALRETIEDPDYILEDSDEGHRSDTAIVLRHLRTETGGYRVILRLATRNDSEGLKNSVITAFFISEKKWGKYLRNKKILYKRV